MRAGTRLGTSVNDRYSRKRGEITDGASAAEGVTSTTVVTAPGTASDGVGVTAAIRAREQDAVDDASVVEQSLAEPELFSTVFDRHARTIRHYLARRVGSQLAEDLTGETFLIAFDRRRRYDLTHRDALPWLYGIASNLLHQHRRAEVRQYRALARTGVDPVLDNHADSVSARVAAEALTRQLAAALARLSAGERDVLLLLAWAGLHYDEIAHSLGIPVGTVRSRLHRARVKVRAAMGGADPTRTSEETHD
jgi:RNA polymerase sigma factor (sigma-70 family)